MELHVDKKVLSNTELGKLKEQQQALFKPTDEKCEEHGEFLVQHKDYRPFCPACASEKVIEDEQKLMEAGTEMAYNQNKLWLKRRSIVIDRDMFKMTFDNYETMDEETTANKEKAIEMARRIYKGSKDNEMLAGRFGTGKTHLAMAVLNQLNEFTDMKLLFVSLDEVMRRIKANFGNPRSQYREDSIVVMLAEADVLVIDDVGSEVGSVDRNSEATDYNVRVLNAVLNGRANKPTIFTTNLSGKDLRDVYDGRIVSRMFRGMVQERIIQFVKTTDKRSEIQF